MYYFIEIACVISEIWMIHMFLKSYFSRKEIPMLYVVLFDVLFGGIVSVLSLWNDMALVRLAVAAVGIFLYSQIAFEARILPGVISSVAFCSFVAITDVATVFVFQCCGVDPSVLMEDHSFRSLLLIAGHIVLFGLVMLICFLNRKNEGAIPVRVLLPVSPCWFVSVLLCILLTWQCYVLNYSWHPLFLVVLIGLLYTNIIIIYYINRSHERAQIQKSLEIAEHHYAMQQEYYDQLRVQQEETRALWHDISKYLRASQVEASNRALEQLQEMLDSVSQVVDVNNRVVSVILNEYVQIARSEQIDLELDVQIPEVLFVTAADLYVLIGNTMDNAVEACQSVPQEDRKITVKLKTHNHILFYEISNPFCEEHLHRVRNNYHGYGLKNVKRCVEKYCGELEVSKDSETFCVRAHLNSI